MTHLRPTSTFISRLAISVVMLLLVMAIPANAQKRNAAAKKNVAERDTVALHLNLRDRYFPVVEVGYGKADHKEENTQMSYKTSAPFFRAGVDFNVLKNKHDIYRLYVGARYAFTSYKYDLASPGVEDPVWGGVTPYEVKGAKCNYHWLEAAVGVDVKLVGPLHLGWSLRYKQKLTADEGKLGKSWYVPGFGKTGTTAFGALFNISLDI